MISLQLRHPMAWLKRERVGTLSQLFQGCCLLEAGIAQLRQCSKGSRAYLAGPQDFRLLGLGRRGHFSHPLRRITDAAHRQNEFWIAWIGLKLAAQTRDVDIYDAKIGSSARGIPPQLLQDFSPWDDMAWIAEEQFQQAELGVREIDALSTTGDLTAVGIDN
jgi:hypothetical protein